MLNVITDLFQRESTKTKQGWIKQGALGTRAPGPHIKGPPNKNGHVLKTMNQNMVELRRVLLLPRANFYLRGSPVPESRSDETSIVMSSD